MQEVLPEDKANFIRGREGSRPYRHHDRRSASTIPRHCLRQMWGIAVSDGAEIAREIADITITADDLQEL